jgi:hypothetical protein
MYQEVHMPVSFRRQKENLNIFTAYDLQVKRPSSLPTVRDQTDIAP